VGQDHQDSGIQCPTSDMLRMLTLRHHKELSDVVTTSPYEKGQVHGHISPLGPISLSSQWPNSCSKNTNLADIGLLSPKGAVCLLSLEKAPSGSGGGHTSEETHRDKVYLPFLPQLQTWFHLVAGSPLKSSGICQAVLYGFFPCQGLPLVPTLWPHPSPGHPHLLASLLASGLGLFYTAALSL
jgi:hypothetical protein